MKRITVYRHAQSLANAGMKTYSSESAGLTPLGQRQAHLLAYETRRDKPDIIIHSPFTRAHDTAFPFRRYFPEVPFEEWPVHEFVILDPRDCWNTTREERADAVKRYWDANEPFLNMTRDEPLDPYLFQYGAESFYDFLDRVNNTVARLTALTANHDNIVVFSHGNFIRAMVWLLFEPRGEFAEWMKSFKTFANHLAIPNTGAVAFGYDDNWKSWSVKHPRIFESMVTW